MSHVVTSWGPAGWELYGRRFVDTFREHWPTHRANVLWCYTEKAVGLGRAAPLLELDLMDVPGCARFLERHAGDDAARGLVPQPCWRRAHVAKGYSFRSDALKFCRKTFALRDAAERIAGGLAAWLDADVITHAPVPRDWLEDLVGDADGAYLGRESSHSECGFMAFRLPAAMPIVRELAGAYESDEVFALPEWHDSFVFDVVRARHPEIRMRNLTPGLRGHVWPLSPLARCTEHLKGDRKREAA